jgi:hypothetical protein
MHAPLQINPRRARIDLRVMSTLAIKTFKKSLNQKIDA